MCPPVVLFLLPQPAMIVSRQRTQSKGNARKENSTQKGNAQDVTGQMPRRGASRSDQTRALNKLTEAQTSPAKCREERNG